MKKKLVSIAMAAVMTAGLLAGCSSSNQSTDSTTDSDTTSSESSESSTDTTTASGGELKIWLPPFAGSSSDVSDVEFWTEQLQPLVAETGCTLNIEIVPWDNYETKYLTGITSGEGPDIGYMYMEMFSDYIKMGALAPIDSYFDQEEKDNYMYYEKGNIDGTQYALPIVIGNARILVANMDILNEAGVTEVPGTLEELVEVSQKIAESNSDVTPIVQAWGDSHYGTLNEVFWPYFWAEGGTILNADGEPDVDTEAGVKAAQYLYDLKFKYNILTDSTTSVNSDDAISQFESGQAAMAMVQSSDAADFISAGMNWDFTTYLQGQPEVGGTFVAADSLVLLNNSENKDLAIKAMKLMTSAKVMEAFHEEIYNAPPITFEEAYKDLDVFKDLYTQNADHLYTLPVFEGATSFYDTLFKNLQNMMLGDMTPEDVMKNTMEYYNTSIKN